MFSIGYMAIVAPLRCPDRRPPLFNLGHFLQGRVDWGPGSAIRIRPSAGQRICGGPVITQFFGGTPAELPGRYREGSVAGLLPAGARQEVFVRAKPADMHGLVEQYVGAAAAGDRKL